jgi:hypothetical protein
MDLGPERKGLEAEKDKRDYQSLFASNVAVSYRKETPSATDSSAPSNPDDLARMLSFYSALGAMQGANSRPDDLSSGLNSPSRLLKNSLFRAKAFSSVFF